uniref:Uncharacterized protein n=1 Tax=Amphimedon queenslandica TaxID=400682 RepID=A0A1X7VGJ3_AMPQE
MTLPYPIFLVGSETYYACALDHVHKQ